MGAVGFIDWLGISGILSSSNNCRDVGGRKFDLNNCRLDESLNSVKNAWWMASNVSWAENVGVVSNSCLKHELPVHRFAFDRGDNHIWDFGVPRDKLEVFRWLLFICRGAEGEDDREDKQRYFHRV
jgi:hypothetical protein